MKISSALFQWIPRFLCIGAIFFVSLFALDSFEAGLTIWQQLAHFFMHLLPSFVLIGLLVIAWNREFTGGIIFILVGLGFSPFIYHHNFNMNQSFWTSMGVVGMITFPFVLVGILFLASYSLKKKNQKLIS